ncbi:leucine-rich_repeat domain-containing protein [Hexamita inflata]|uniref:Leucine-rich repeat domain-containing protein n=1 Tax=Hexamita inflata TaxID=28002 RepID=A0AA86NCL1_9EUKA|nr:leucine-rich repeat domain-containing protein [Hexamita inflata]
MKYTIPAYLRKWDAARNKKCNLLIIDTKPVFKQVRVNILQLIYFAFEPLQIRMFNRDYYQFKEILVIHQKCFQKLCKGQMIIEDLMINKTLSHLYLQQINDNIILGDYIKPAVFKTLSISRNINKKQYILDLNIFSTLDECNITSLNITNFEIINIQALFNYNLENLSIVSNQFSYFEKSQLDKAQLQNLLTLKLYKCNFREIHFLQNMPELKELTLQENNLENSDFKDCQFRKLQVLNVSSNNLESLDYLDVSQNLYHIDASYNKIKVLFKECSQVLEIDELDLSNNKLNDLSGLRLCTKLKYLNINYNSLRKQAQVQILSELSIQDLNVVDTNLNVLQHINTVCVTALQFSAFLKSVDFSNIFNFQNIRQLNMRGHSPKITNQQLKSLQITKIDHQITQLSGFNKVMTIHPSVTEILTGNLYRQLKQYIRNQNTDLNDFIRTIHQLNYQFALHLKQEGFQVRQNRSKIFYDLNIFQVVNRDKRQANQRVKKLFEPVTHISLIGYE